MNINEIKADLQIIGSKIERLNIENSFVYIDLVDSDIKREIGASYKISKPYILDDEDETIAANLMLTVNLEISDGTYSAKVDMDLEGCFVLENSKDEKALLDMLPVNGCAALYSIARGIISSVTSHMCVNGTIIIPMINAYEFVEKTDEIDE